MTEEKPRPEPAREPAPRDDITVGANRCPFCHEQVQAKEWVACAACLARHHEACWAESGRCATCRYETKLRPDEKRASAGPWIVALFVIGFLLSGAIFVWGLVSTGEATRREAELQAKFAAEKAERDAAIAGHLAEDGREVAVSTGPRPVPRTAFNWSRPAACEEALTIIARRLPGADQAEGARLRMADEAIRRVVRPSGTDEPTMTILESQDDYLMLPARGQPGFEDVPSYREENERRCAVAGAKTLDRAYLAHVLVRLGEADAALAQVNLALDHDGTLPLPWAVRAQALLALGAARDAREDARIGEALCSASPGWALLAEAEAYEGFGELEPARARYEALLEEDLVPPKMGIREELATRIARLDAQLGR
jgi:hypothetical protein